MSSKRNNNNSLNSNDQSSKVCKCIRHSLLARLLLLMLFTWVGGLIWFFYPHSKTWGQLYHLCQKTSTDFVVSLYTDCYDLYLSTTHTPANGNIDSNIITHNNDSFLNNEMLRQNDAQKSKKVNKRDNCLNKIVNENFEPMKFIPHSIIDENKSNSLNKLLYDISEHFNKDIADSKSKSKSKSNSKLMTFSMELNKYEMHNEFESELIFCNEFAANKYLTDFAPILGFHLLCFNHFPLYSQTLIIAYMHGYKKDKLPSIPYKNRKKCHIRNIEQNNIIFNNNINNDTTYYVTNECERLITPKKDNPKYLLVTIHTMKDLRRHLQNHLIDDTGSYDQYTIEGKDISDEYNQQHTNNNQQNKDSFNPLPPATDHPATQQLLMRIERKRITQPIQHNTATAEQYPVPFRQPIDSNKKKNDDNNNNKLSDKKRNNIVSQYRKNPFAMYYPNGKSLSYYLTKKELLNPNQTSAVIFLFEGGRFMWPGIHRGHVITLPIGPDIQLRTINMRPLIFEISGLITSAEVEYLRNKSLPTFTRSEVGLNAEKKISDSRTCESAWLFGEQDIIVNSLKNRCSKILLIPKSHMEDMEVVRYAEGQRFDMHYDAFQQHDAISLQSQIILHGEFKNRIATILYYLSDISSLNNTGGFTVFPRYDNNIQFDMHGIEKHNNGQEIILSDKCCQIHNNKNDDKYGLKIKPKHGKVLLFYNMLPNGELDPAALHGGCKLRHGTKWAANQWVWNRPFNQQ